MYKIDNIPMIDYGLHIISHEGYVPLNVPKQQFYTIYGKQGYQITKRKTNTLTLNGFIVAKNMVDFHNKVTNLNNAFKAPGLRTIMFQDDEILCYSRHGSSVSGLHISNSVIAKYQIKLMIVGSSYTPANSNRVFTNQFNSVFGNNVLTVPETGIFNSKFNSKFN